MFVPLDDYIAKNPGYSDFDPSLFKYSSYQGKTYFVPIGWNNIMINYNRALFKEAGVEYPKDWTWEQFREVAKKLTKRDAAGNVLQYGYEVPNQNFFVQPWFLTNGTSPLNADWTASNMLDPKVAETLQFLHDLIHVDKVSPIPGKDTMDNQFAAGQVAMIIARPLDHRERQAGEARHGYRRRALEGERKHGDWLRRLRRRRRRPSIPTSPRNSSAR